MDRQQFVEYLTEQWGGYRFEKVFDFYAGSVFEHVKTEAVSRIASVAGVLSQADECAEQSGVGMIFCALPASDIDPGFMICKIVIQRKEGGWDAAV